MEAPPSVAAVSHKNWLPFEHNWSRHSPSLSWVDISPISEMWIYPNNEAVLTRRPAIVGFPVQEIGVHASHGSATRGWVSSLPECGASRLDPLPSALHVKIGGAEVGLSPTASFPEQRHHKVVLTLTFYACEITAWMLVLTRSEKPSASGVCLTWPKALTSLDSLGLSEWDGGGLHLIALQPILPPTTWASLWSGEPRTL